MNEPETAPAAPTELADQISALQRQVTLLLVALVVVSSTVTAYLFYQMHILGKELEGTRPRALQIIQNYNKEVPRMQKLVEELTAYSKTHPDFQPILVNYGIVSAATNAAPRTNIAPKK